MRIAVVGGGGWRWPIIKLETNQGLLGLGEVRDGASARYALMLKSRLLNENPCDIDRLFQKIKQFGGHGRLGGGVCGIEMALCDLAGKAYGVPAYMFAGGKYRDKVKVYSDTPSLKDPEEMGKALKGRMDRGFEFLKMDIGLWIAAEFENGVINKTVANESATLMHPFTGIQVTDYGISKMQEYVGAVRQIIGYEIPLASDHFGHMGVENAIRIGKALDQFTLAWYEDMIPWQFVDQWQALKAGVDTPVCTGEDIYLKEGFEPLVEARAISVAHPDLATSGGIIETKRIADYCRDAGIGIALHQAGSPVVAMANAHSAMAMENFIALEMHSVDNPWWNDLVDIVGQDGDIIKNGYVEVTDAPGLGLELNEEAIKEHLAKDSERRAAVYPKGAFEDTSDWDQLDAHDRTWS
ncbi:MAG: mandelate racemase/muconate lactonizing enzyme family protein [SAR202 cluster bacterium]|nr:mandelate racemase/muconate lactonizing enzyme family protein [SAR202 cluster bacterium]|tara:strand:+ start:1563 stop:2792 length:1230 start_codon:yes stop_codon:yes gene_type:complete